MTPEERQLYKDFKETFNSPHGERVVANLKKKFHFDLVIIPRGVDGHTDVYEILRNEGKRTVVNYILAMVNTNLDETKQADAVHETIT